jgi:poly(3-hydroxybutyrate) depolymerase
MTVRIALLFALVACAQRSPNAVHRFPHDAHVASSNETTDETPRVTHNVVEPPCSGCTVDFPSERTDLEPLLVVLHGNREPASTASARWRDAALARGFVVVGLQCPRELGCVDGKWYAWRDTPTFVLEALATLKRELHIDPARTYLAGWSGGASAIGLHLAAWGPFSALVLHGGGQPPNDSLTCPPHAMPAYFLVGDGNPDHSLAIKLRDHLAHCGREAPLEWDVLHLAGHADEERALNRAKADQILDWLDLHAT